MESDDFDPAPRTGDNLPPSTRLIALADSLDCMLKHDVCVLAAVKESTTDAWAKRGDGPPYVMFGNRRLYPREGVKKFLRDRLRERVGIPARSLL